jgi:hypothetical protein
MPMSVELLMNMLLGTSVWLLAPHSVSLCMTGPHRDSLWNKSCVCDCYLA